MSKNITTRCGSMLGLGIDYLGNHGTKLEHYMHVLVCFVRFDELLYDGVYVMLYV